MTETPDRLVELLRRSAPSARFDAAGVEARITRSTRRHVFKRTIVLWSLRTAAAGAFFLAGTYYANGWATNVGLRQLGRIEGLPSAPGAPRMLTGEVAREATLPLSIQQTGSGYMASLAALAEVRDRLSPEEREMARQVAISVLAGAITELAAAGDGRLPPEIVRTVMVHAAPTTDAVPRRDR